MTARFVLGRAGSGKTHHCLNAVRTALADSASDGPPLVLLVPEQASLQMERALVCNGPVRATSRAEVLSFRRLAFRICQNARQPLGRALSANGRAMVLRAVVGRLQDRLQFYRRVERLTGFFERLGHTCGELIDEGVSPDELEEAAYGAAHPRTAGKLADLSLIYRAYLQQLGTDWLDSSQSLQLARQALARTDYLQGAHVWVDGFSGFTGLEQALLIELMQRAAHTDVALLLDARQMDHLVELSDVDPADLFARTQRTYVRLRQALTDAGIAVEPPLILSHIHRFCAGCQLARLESSLADETGRDQRVETDAADDRRDSPVMIISAADRRAEVEAAIHWIHRQVDPAHGNLRYRDLAIVVRDLAPYQDLLADALDDHDIPYFIDWRRSLAHHPVVEFMRAALGITAEGFTLEPMRRLLKTGAVDMTVDQADELENYLLAHGITGRTLWTGGDWTFLRDRGRNEAHTAAVKRLLERVNKSRVELLRILQPLTELADATSPAAGWVAAIRTVLTRADVERRLADWARAAEESGDMVLADEHRHVGVALEELLDELSAVLGETRFDATRITQIIEAGLAQMTRGVIPPTVDQVLVGSIERSRHPELVSVCVLGFNDGLFPQHTDQDSILHDEDREALSDLSVQVGVTSRQRVLDERMLVYITTTRPSRHLTILFAANDEQGRSLAPSPYLDSIQTALPEVTVGSFAPHDRLTPRHIHTVANLAASLNLEMRHRSATDEGDTTLRTHWNDLYTLARDRPDWRKPLSDALAALVFENRAALSTASVGKMVRGTYRASVSELESFAACPFKRFAEYGLRLSERLVAPLDPADVGTIHHAILEEFLNDLIAGKQSLSELTDDQIASVLEAVASRIGAQLSDRRAPTSARDAYLIERSAAHLSPVMREQQRVTRSGRFRPAAAEARFGFDDDKPSLPPLEISTPGGRRVLLRGFIDRVDLAEVSDQMLGIVVDYKRTRDKRLDLSQVYHGLSLQLIGYLLALAQRGESLAGRPIIPAGAFYVSLLQKYRPVDHPDEADEKESSATGTSPRGVLNVEYFDKLDANAPPAGWSSAFTVYRKKDGGIGHADRTDAATARQFEHLLEHTKRKLGALADGVLDGDVSVAPYRLGNFSPCHWCRMQSVCRFEFGDPMRRLDRMKQTEVWKKLDEHAS